MIHLAKEVISSTDHGGGKRRPVIAEYFFVLIEIS